MSEVSRVQEPEPRGRTYGDLDPALNWSCGFGETATSPPCMDPARWHGIIIGDKPQAMSSCDVHRAVMALSADWVHEMDSPCFLPGSRFFWPENECRMPDEDAALPALAEVSRG